MKARGSDRRFPDQIQKQTRRGRSVVVNTTGAPDIAGDLIAAAIAYVQRDRARVQSLLIVPDAEDVEGVRAITDQHVADRGRRDITVAHLGPAANVREESRTISANPAVLVTTTDRLIDHIRRGNVDLSHVTACVIRPPQQARLASFGADLQFIYTKFDREPATVVFSPDGGAGSEEIESLLRRPVTISLDPSAEREGNPTLGTQQENGEMARRNLPFDPESTAQTLRGIVRKIHEDEDANVMNHYRRFIRKHVPIFSRGYFTAYLFKHYAGDEGGDGGDSSGRTSIFVSAGRNRRVHARDLVTLFTSADGVTRDDIGQIKVLDNYSFVEVESPKAKAVIDSLNGTEFRGRKLTVNYARRK